jgi:hypothetical protein
VIAFYGDAVTVRPLACAATIKDMKGLPNGVSKSSRLLTVVAHRRLRHSHKRVPRHNETVSRNETSQSCSTTAVILSTPQAPS